MECIVRDSPAAEESRRRSDKARERRTVMAMSIGHGADRLCLPPSVLLSAIPLKVQTEVRPQFRLDAFCAVRMIPGCLASLPPSGRTESTFAANGACLAPSGSIPRLLLTSLLTQAIASSSRTVELGGLSTLVLESVGMITYGGGSTGAWTRGREQIRRLFGSDISFRPHLGAPWASVLTHPHAKVIRDRFFMEAGARETDDLLCDSVEFSQAFMDWYQQRETSADFETLMQVKSMPSAFDLYAWLAERAQLSQRQANVISRFGMPMFSSTPCKKKETELMRRQLAHVLKYEPSFARHAETFCCAPDHRVAAERVGKPPLGRRRVQWLEASLLTKHLDREIDAVGSAS